MIQHLPLEDGSSISLSMLALTSWIIYYLFLKKVWKDFVRLYLGIEFYLFVSRGGMNDRGPTCKFHNARSAFRNLHVDPLSFIPPWETNKANSILIFILQNWPVLAIKYPCFNKQPGGIQNNHGNSRLIRHGNGFVEEWMLIFFLCS